MFTRSWEVQEVFGLGLGKNSAVLPIPKRGLSQSEVDEVRKFVERVGPNHPVTNLPR